MKHVKLLRCRQRHQRAVPRPGRRRRSRHRTVHDATVCLRHGVRRQRPRLTNEHRLYRSVCLICQLALFTAPCGVSNECGNKLQVNELDIDNRARCCRSGIVLHCEYCICIFFRHKTTISSISLMSSCKLKLSGICCFIDSYTATKPLSHAAPSNRQYMSCDVSGG